MGRYLVVALILVPALAWAQSVPVICVGTSDPKVSACEAVVNSDGALPGGNYRVDVASEDKAGNIGDAVTAATVTVPTSDATKPTVASPTVTAVGAKSWKINWLCNDDVACNGGSVKLVPVP